MGEYLTRTFFEEELPQLAEAYAREAKAERLETEIMLRTGVALKMEGSPTCTDGYVAVDYKSGANLRRAILPYSAIVGVAFIAEGGKAMGFHL